MQGICWGASRDEARLRRWRRWRAGCARRRASLRASRAGAARRTLDAFDSLGGWSADASDDVRAGVQAVPGKQRPGLSQLDFRLQRPLGSRRRCATPAVDLARTSRSACTCAATRRSRTCNSSCSTHSGDNVWWFREPALVEARGDWTRCASSVASSSSPGARRRTIRCATRTSWRSCSQPDRGEGHGGVRRFDPSGAPAAAPVLPRPLAIPRRALPRRRQRSPSTGGATLPGEVTRSRRRSCVELDLGVEREFGGIVARWADDAAATRYDVELSSDRQEWTQVRSVSAGQRRPRWSLCPTPTRATCGWCCTRGRATTTRSPKEASQPLDFGSPNAFASALAKAARAASFRAPSSASRTPGRWSARMAAARARCSPRTGRWRGGRGQLFNRAVRAVRREALQLGRRSPRAVPARGLRADPERHLANRRLAAAHHHLGGERAGACGAGARTPADPLRAGAPGEQPLDLQLLLAVRPFRSTLRRSR